MGHLRRTSGPAAADCTMTNSFVTNAVLIERAVNCWHRHQLISETTQYLDSWQSDLLQSELKMKLLELSRGRHVHQCQLPTPLLAILRFISVVVLSSANDVNSFSPAILCITICFVFLSFFLCLSLFLSLSVSFYFFGGQLWWASASTAVISHCSLCSLANKLR